MPQVLGILSEIMYLILCRKSEKEKKEKKRNAK